MKNQGVTGHNAVLYVVATPIGNRGDMVPRAVETLQQVDLIAAEDTRHSKPLLEAFHISTPMLAYHDHNETQITESLIAKLIAGQNIALISDAGTPLLSDPGYRLVRAAHQANIRVVPIPGASAMVAALSAAGLPSDKFIFEGFLPAKSTQRRKRFAELKKEPRTLLFYEAPHRLIAFLEDLQAEIGGDRELVMAREITKTFETIKAGSVSSILEFIKNDANQCKGEIVLLLHGYDVPVRQVIDLEIERMMRILLKELSLKQASNLVAEITGVNKKILYQWGVDNKD